MAAGIVLRDGAPALGVAVSDGTTVALTDGEGRFELDGSGPFVFVVRPSGESAEPWYLPPGDDLTFELRPSRSYSAFVQVTDLHLSLGDPSYGPDAGDATFFVEAGVLRERIVTTPEVLSDLFEEIHRAEPGALVIATGDVTNSGASEEFGALSDVLARATAEIVVMPGNHDLMPQDAGETGADGLHNFTAVTARYERTFGPRWFSFDLAGVHIVAIDWFTHRLGIDPDEQEAWIAEDLAATDLPYILLSHDLMGADFFERLPRAPMASFSGHWHTSRVVSHAGVLHVNTGPATFGGLDYSPPQMRVVRWGGGLEVRTITRGREPGAEAGQAAWTASLDGGAHMAPPVIVGDSVLVASGHEDRARGALESFSIDDGSLRWRIVLGAAVKAAPLVVGDLAIATAVTGETVAVDVATGTERWRTELADPFRLWCYLRPASDGARVFVGDVARFVALDLHDGQVVWAREDLGKRENVTSHAHPVVVDGTLLVSFSAQIPDAWGLDPGTGAARWPDVPSGRSVYQGTQDEIVMSLPRTPVGPFAPDPDGADAFVVRLGSVVERISAATGSVVWSAPFLGWFNPGRPAVTSDAVVVSASMGSVWSFDRATGDLRWRTEVASASPVAYGAYRDRGPSLLAGPAIAGSSAVVPTGDGGLVALDLADGSILGRAEVGAPVLARAAVTDEHAIVAGVDGRVRAVPLERLGVYHGGRSSLYV